jgi:hypothetical protein
MQERSNRQERARWATRTPEEARRTNERTTRVSGNQLANTGEMLLTCRLQHCLPLGVRTIDVPEQIVCSAQFSPAEQVTGLPLLLDRGVER